MGEVYAAYDPELDRKVAVKRLRAGGVHGRRLVSEARALARLSHENVIGVYDVGVSGEQVFLAMELVEGRDLGVWLADHRGDWHAICEVFAKAGRGLAAAHAAGLVHRDFKPANVVVGKRGAVKVVDFGLAVEGGNHGGGGTPGYMAPETVHGGLIEARADIYSFCVSLFEALYGRRPFVGEDPQALQDAKRSGLQVPNAKVPRGLQRLVEQGLAVDPDSRFASMDEVVRELERYPRRSRRNRWWTLAGALLSLVLAAWVWSGADSPADDGRRQLDTVWSLQAKQQVRQVLVARGGEASWRRVEPTLDEYTREWLRSYVEARQATEVRGEQSVALMDLRVGCLRARLSEFRALVDQLAKAKELAPQAAERAAQSLTPLDGCSDVDVLTATVRPPPAEVAQEVAALREQLDTAEALERLGHYNEGLELAESIAARARDIGYEPLVAEALFELGVLRRTTGDPTSAEKLVLASSELAERSEHKTIEALAAVEMLFLLGSYRTRFTEARLWGWHARGAVLRKGVPAYIKVGMLEVQGLVASQMGDYDTARTAYLAALELPERGKLDRAVTLYNLAWLDVKTARIDEAQRHAERAYELAKAFEPRHPSVGRSLIQLGTIYLRLGDGSVAIDCLQQALTIVEQAYGPDDPFVARAHSGLGLALASVGRLAEGEFFLQRALSVLRRDDDPAAAAALSGLGYVHRRAGDHVTAEWHVRRGLELRQSQLGPDHAEVALALWETADELVCLNRCTEARDLLQRAADIYTRAGLAQTSWATGVQQSQVDALECLGRAQQAAQIFADTPISARGRPSRLGTQWGCSTPGF